MTGIQGRALFRLAVFGHLEAQAPYVVSLRSDVKMED